MATVATQAIQQLANDWEDAIDSAVLSGIVGDARHDGGYHISREDNDPDDYSVQLPEDREGHSDWAAGIDMNMNPADMKLVTGRLLASAKDQNDPRLNYCREFYGTLDGKTVTGWDTYYGIPSDADDTHLWHVHVSFLRKYANDPAAMDAVLSIIEGKPYQESNPGEDDDMPQGWGPAQLPTEPNVQRSYSIWPVNDGVAGFGPAWMTIWGTTRSALRLALSDGSGKALTVINQKLVLEPGKQFNLSLPSKTRGISITRIPADDKDDCAGSVSMSIEYARR